MSKTEGKTKRILRPNQTNKQNQNRKKKRKENEKMLLFLHWRVAFKEWTMFE